MQSRLGWGVGGRAGRGQGFDRPSSTHGRELEMRRAPRRPQFDGYIVKYSLIAHFMGNIGYIYYRYRMGQFSKAE